MNISNIHLINFKRFTDLWIRDIPASSKLVLLIGSNGSGKSSLFDAFGFVDAAFKQDVVKDQAFWDYFKKKAQTPLSVRIRYADGSEIRVGEGDLAPMPLRPHAFYGRTSFRQIPRLTRTALGQGQGFDLYKDSDRPKFFIERDQRFENDIEKITEIILKDFFRSGKTGEQIRQTYIEPINLALQRIFGSGNGTKLQLIEIIPPLDGKVAQITFGKGESEIHYNCLSAGEKEIFNLLINLLIRMPLYKDTVYFLDEMDLHLNTKIQYRLLQEVVENWIPEGCQLWTATHALGFIEYAKQSPTASIVDFDDLDFDLPRVLLPEPKDNPDIYEIAVSKEFLPALFRDMRLCFVENKDKEYYASIGLPGIVFISDNNRNGVFHKTRTGDYQGIVDRDFLSDDDIKQIRKNYPNLTVLHYYSIENYLYHPDNLEEYYFSKNQKFDKQVYIKQLTEAKNQAKDAFIPTLSLKRTEYPYFGEPEYGGSELQNRFKNKQENQVQSSSVAAYLNSNDFETYYKVLPMKSYCTQMEQRQHIPKKELARTDWFKSQMRNLLDLDGYVC